MLLRTVEKGHSDRRGAGPRYGETRRGGAMNRYERAIEILNAAVGGPTAPVGGPHQAFWRGKTRAQFVAFKVLNRPIVTPGNGAGSTIVQAMRGQGDFGSDTGNEDAIFRRMPAGRPAVPDADIAFIQQWI